MDYGMPQVKPTSAMQYLQGANSADNPNPNAKPGANNLPDYLKHQDNPSMAGGVSNMVRALLGGLRQRQQQAGQGGGMPGGQMGQNMMPGAQNQQPGGAPGAPLDLTAPNPMAGMVDPNTGMPLSNPMNQPVSMPGTSPFDEAGFAGLGGDAAAGGLGSLGGAAGFGAGADAAGMGAGADLGGLGLAALFA